MPAEPLPLGTYPDERNPIPSAEGTGSPVWIIATLRRGGEVLYHAGVWFRRDRAEAHLTASCCRDLARFLDRVTAARKAGGGS